MVVYVAFVVFLVVIVAIDTVLVRAIPTASGVDSGAAVGGGAFQFVGVTAEQLDQYRFVFFHAALVAGQMASATVKAGAKHATAMLAVTYVVFLVL